LVAPPLILSPHPSQTQVTDFCSNSTRSSWPVCDASLPPSKRAADIISRLSLPDKIAALGTDTPALNSAGLRPYVLCLLQHATMVDVCGV
jgi:hypothetical protein